MVWLNLISAVILTGFAMGVMTGLTYLFKLKDHTWDNELSIAVVFGLVFLVNSFIPGLKLLLFLISFGIIYFFIRDFYKTSFLKSLAITLSLFAALLLLFGILIVVI